MRLLWGLRVALYLQLVLGLARGVGPSAGFVLNQRIWEWHILFGVLAVVLAVIALRPLPGVPHSGIRNTARFIGFAPLLLGLGLLFNALEGPAVTGLHMLFGIAMVALVEMAAARQRRALA